MRTMSNCRQTIFNLIIRKENEMKHRFDNILPKKAKLSVIPSGFDNKIIYR